MLKKYKEDLVHLGLTEKESLVYLALLELGSATADQTSKLAGLNRSTTYVQIENLTKLGLATSFKKGKKTYFAAESPTNFERVLRNKADEFKLQQSHAASLLPELTDIFVSAGERPQVRVFEGKEGLTALREEMLHKGTKDLCIIGSFDSLGSIFTSRERDDFSARRDKRGITSHVIYTLEKGPDVKPTKFQKLKRIQPEQLPFDSDVYIFKDTVSFTSINDNNVIGVTVTNAGVATTMKAIFSQLWNTL